MKQLQELIESIKTNDVDRFGKLAENIESLEEELKDLVRKPEEQNIKIQELLNEIEKSRNVNEIPKERIIQLENKIMQLQLRIKEESCDSRIELPIIDNSVKLKVDKFVVVKEIKTAVYMNSLLEYVNNTAKINFKFKKRKTLIVVFDPLVDEFRIAKYKKMDFQINEVPSESMVLVTNYSLDKLQQLVNFEEYDELIVFDRMMKTECAVKNTKEDIYYLIDSPSDKIDFNLNSRKCVGFFSDEFVCEYNIIPGIDVTKYQGKIRAALIGASDFVMRVLCNDI